MLLNRQMSVRPYPHYEINFLDVGDADCIVIRYTPDVNTAQKVAVIDAGNVSDSEMIKEFLKFHCQTDCVDLAVCTHPDGDHKGGFFDLLEDPQIIFREFWLKDPFKYVNDRDFARMKRTDNKIDACRCAYNHPSICSKNMIDLILSKRNKDGTVCKCYNACPGRVHEILSIKVIGPLESYYAEAALGIVQGYAELKAEPDTEKYDELCEISEEDAKSVIDEEHDSSYTNQGSLILYFKPTSDFSVLLPGDASDTSLQLVYNANQDIAGSVLKVPHHGSKHNLTSALIDDIRPMASIISAAGTKKHPNSAVVRYLSKYGNVYSTHKSGRLYYSDQPPMSLATPLKKKSV